MIQEFLQAFYRIRDQYKWRITSVLIILFSTASIQAQSVIPELVFKHPLLKTGKGCSGEGQDGAVYIFENVGWGIDALVSIEGRSSTEVSMSSSDIEGPEEDAEKGIGYEDAWQPRIRYGNGEAPANKSWWMEFKISFVKHANEHLPVSVNQFFVYGLDIDGDGKQLHEFQSYFKVKSFTLERQTAIFASSIVGSEMDPLVKGKRFDGPTTDYPGIAYYAEDAMVSNFYTGVNTMVVRLGAETGTEGSQAADRMYALLFRSLAFGIPPKAAPVNMVAASGAGESRIQ
jgi:hypothetical protein